LALLLRPLGFSFTRCCGGLFATTPAASSKRCQASGWNSISFDFGFSAMSKKPAATFEKVESALLYEVPASISREIGRIIVRWAYFEHSIQQVVWLLVGVDQTIGSYSVREPRITERIDMIQDLASLRSTKLKDELWFQAYRVQADAAQSRRDLLAHGLWTSYPDGSLRVVKTRGQHPKSRKQVPHRSRKVVPEGLSVTAKDLRWMTRMIDLLITDAVNLEKSAQEQLRASPGKSS
jgi:hypothetical protein